MTFYYKFRTTLLPSGGFFDPNKIQSEIDKLTIESNTPDLWDKPDYARGILQKKSNLEKQLAELNGLESEYKNLTVLYEIALDDNVVNSVLLT